MKKEILIHVPHSSTKIPNIFYKNKILNKNDVTKLNQFLCDKYVDKLIPKSYTKLIFKYSRIFCDVERYKDYDKEIMYKYGMGICYTKDNKGNTFIKHKKGYEENVIKNYYDKHHKKLDKLSKEKLRKYNTLYLFDFHSYSSNLVKDLFNKENNPDICIGFNEYFKSDELIIFTKKFFEQKGFSIKYNYPYEGTIIPNYYYNKRNVDIKSIMIELNKRIYMDDNKLNLKKFIILKKVLKDYFKELEKIK